MGSSATAQGGDHSRQDDLISRTAPIAEALAEKRSAERDRRLHDLAVDLFKVIEAAPNENVGEARAVMARALREAAEGDLPEAWVDYGRCLWNGWGVLEDRAAALAAYKKAAALGSDHGAYVAAYNFYWQFSRYDEAYTFARQAAKTDLNGEAHYLLGLMAYHGRGRTKDMKESLRLHQEAGKRGNADALFELFVYAYKGIGDGSKAISYLREAAERQHPRALANLAALHATGMRGVPKNLELSVELYRRAADKGNGRAAAALGVMALRGEGMPADTDAAKAFFACAEALGYDVDGYLEEIGLARP